MEAPAKALSAQPRAATQMSVTNPAPVNSTQHMHEHKANRIRGGGAAKDCFLGAVECFLCFEGCKECCECCADIVCCPCEQCC